MRWRMPRPVARWAGDALHTTWEAAAGWAAINADSRRARRFGAFGAGSHIRFPVNTLYNERYIRLGSATLIGPQVTLAVGMAPGQVMMSDPVISIGDRCLIGRGSGIVGHLSIDIGDDVFTGHFVYITDQNHGYADTSVPIGRQTQTERAVVIGAGSWIGHGAVVLPGARIGRHCVVGANSVVTGEVPDYSIAVGAPARVIRTAEVPPAV
jgi:acetyltransferase-like isoleucine patch superfamily enzyme